MCALFWLFWFVVMFAVVVGYISRLRLLCSIPTMVLGVSDDSEKRREYTNLIVKGGERQNLLASNPREEVESLGHVIL